MRLSDYKDDAAIELVAELMIPATEIMADESIANAFRSGQPKLMVAKTLLKSKAAAVRQVFAILNGVEEYHCTPISLMKDLLDLLNDPELMELFTSAQTESEEE